MAESFFNRMTDVSMAAFSAGTNPAKFINPRIITVMQEVDIDISKSEPKLLTEEMLTSSDIVITMGCGVACPCLVNKQTIDWGLSDPEGKELQEIRRMRDQIKEKISGLIDELNKNKD